MAAHMHGGLVHQLQWTTIQAPSCCATRRHFWCTPAGRATCKYIRRVCACSLMAAVPCTASYGCSGAWGVVHQLQWTTIQAPPCCATLAPFLLHASNQSNLCIDMKCVCMQSDGCSALHGKLWLPICMWGCGAPTSMDHHPGPTLLRHIAAISAACLQ